MRNLTPSFLLEHMAKSHVHGHFDAVVLFVDTSGFTPLTARLSEWGRDGAEVLAEILLAVFEPLVAAVYAHGGFIAGFAGDAFKAVFPMLTPESYLHALAAAEQIRSHMTNHPTHETRYDVFAFSVRMSLAAGQVTWAVWSGTTGEAAQSHGYTFAGPALDAAIRGEDHADGGELVVTNSVFAALEMAQGAALASEMLTSGVLTGGVLTGKVLTDAATGYVRIEQFTGMLPAPLARASMEDVALAAAARFYPATLLNMATQGEFRPVYTLFLNVASLPDPGSRDDFLPLFFQLLHQYGGYLCRIGRIGANDPGGTFLLFWGAPTSHENDLHRALSFLVDLRSQIVVPLRAGVTYSTVYAGFIGSQLREEYTCYGSSVNQAARQMTMATWDQILLDAESARRAQDEFDVALAGRYALKGIAEEQALFSLAGQRTQSAEHLYHANFIGRDNELTQLQRAIQPIFSGTFGGITLVRGEAGIGKSRLVHEFIMMTDALEDVQIYVGQVDEILRASLNPFRYFLRRYFEQSPDVDEATNKERFDTTLDALVTATAGEVLSSELTRTRSFLGALVNLHWTGSLYAQLEPQLRYENTLGALKTLIQAESLRQPLILLVEDGHWLDAESLVFLESLTRNVDDFPFAILITSRSVEGGVAEDEAASTPLPELAQKEILVEALSETEVADLAHDYLGTRASVELVQLLAARAEGNPFFAEQMLLYLQEQGLLVEEATGWQLMDKATESENVLPTDIQSVLVARLDRLTQEVKQVVQTAAVLGREFSVQILSQMLRDELALEDKVKSAEESSVWNSLSELRYLFRHALLRDAAYEMQLRARLRGLHKAAAEATEVLFQTELASYYADLLYHYHHADVAEKEHHFARLAGEQAAENFANRAAITYFERALELTPESAIILRFDLLMACKSLHALIGDPIAQLDNLILLADLSKLMSEPTRQAEVALAYAGYYIAISDYTAAGEAAQRTVELAEMAGNIRLQSAGYQKRGGALWHQSQYRESLEMTETALRLSRSAGLREQKAEALITSGIAYWYLGDYPMAQQKMEESLPIYAEIGDPFARQSALSFLAVIAQISGNDRIALDYFQQTIALEREMGARKAEAGTISLMVSSYCNVGEYGRALDRQQAVLPILEEINERFGITVAHTNLGTIMAELGDYVQARWHWGYALKMARIIGSRAHESALSADLGKLDFLDGNQDAAIDKVQESLQIAREIETQTIEAIALIRLGNILLALSRREEAATAFADALLIQRNLGETHRSIEAIAGLACVALSQQDIATAAAHVEEILGYLETRSPEGIPGLFQIYWTCYEVLRTIGDVRSSALLATAHQQLQKRAANIHDWVLRDSFLKFVTPNQAIVSAYGLQSA